MAEKNENARTIQDEPTVEIRKTRKDRRVEEENRNRRTEIIRRGSEEISQRRIELTWIVQERLSKQVRAVRRETQKRSDDENEIVYIGLATKERASNKKENTRIEEKASKETITSRNLHRLRRNWRLLVIDINLFSSRELYQVHFISISKTWLDLIYLT